ncbi:chromate resistance protein ChrB domain-containing protein [Mucilaginibacter sp. CSA2-8R]|uniref:chromate resistance protein ChrB domain-containing protein n=1 Tax=Mucilaginibacter sp. CSA2-8R TaxID=3141542 RepID=UPI00315DB6E4
MKRFVESDAESLDVLYDEVFIKAKVLSATPFAMPGVEYSHYEDQCTFDYFIKKHRLNYPALKRMVAIVRGADTDHHDFALQSAGMEAIFMEFSYQIKNDKNC